MSSFARISRMRMRTSSGSELSGRQGEDFLQLPAKMRTRRRFPEGPDLEFLELALVRGQGAALKTIILQHQFHPIYRLIVWFTNTRAKTRASPRDFAACGPPPRHLFAPFKPKTCDASFCSVAKSHAKACPGQETNSRKLYHVRGRAGCSDAFSGTKADLGLK